MDPESPFAVISAQLDAYNSHDVGRMMSYYAEDAVITDGDGEVLDEGRDAIREAMAAVFDRIPDVRCEYRAPIEVGPWVAVLSVVPNWRVDGRPQEMRWLEVFHVIDGKIKELRLHE
jgi:uncharacterized protein (TIGR02246 family)